MTIPTLALTAFALAFAFLLFARWSTRADATVDAVLEVAAEPRASAAAATARRRRPFWAGAAVAVLVLVAIVLAVVLGGGSSRLRFVRHDRGVDADVHDDGGRGRAPQAGRGQSAPRRRHAAREHPRLPAAPVTMIEYADLQCPFCGEFATAALPSS